MDNKQIVQQFIENLFINNDVAYSVVSNDVRVNWPGFGMEDIVGKEDLQNFLANGGPDKVIEQKINNLIGEGNIVIGDGTMVTERNGVIETCHFADIYTIKDGEISELKSYMVVDQSNK